MIDLDILVYGDATTAAKSLGSTACGFASSPNGVVFELKPVPVHVYELALLEVTDHGIGISSEDLGRIFFFREFATAVAGWVLGINPFNQPNYNGYSGVMTSPFFRPRYARAKACSLATSSAVRTGRSRGHAGYGGPLRSRLRCRRWRARRRTGESTG